MWLVRYFVKGHAPRLASVRVACSGGGHMLMTDKPETIGFYRRRLPHWEVADGRYFVTVCQHGAIPKAAAARIHRMSRTLHELKGGELLDQKRRIFKEMEAWLDHPKFPGLFSAPDLARIMIDAIEYRKEKSIWRIAEYVVMPTHIHLFFQPLRTNLRNAMISFKNWTAHQANQKRLLPDGSLWQREWFDHWSRTPEEDLKIAAYIRRNPVKAGLTSDYPDWPYGSWKK
jgi:REP element-mobilizing transposase RayT